MKTKLLFIINQFFRGGAETALLNLFRALPQKEYEIDFLVFDQIDLPGVITLLPEVPEWVHVLNPAGREGSTAFLKKAGFRFFRAVFHRQMFRSSVIDYLRGKHYDAVISFGEWFSSRLAAEYVRARRKYVWIHADLDKAKFLHPDILAYQQCFDRFLFASERSMKGAAQKAPALCRRGTVIHNLVDEAGIRALSYTPLVGYEIPENMPVLVTVANLRPEKNHLRQVRVMKRLAEQGVHVLWLNAGNLANPVLTGQVRAAIEEAGLSDSFQLLGSVENPYTLMKRADAVCVLSDHESWSMVITEAKTLGVPVIATRTSGAAEQLVHMETGVLCDFTEEDIAERIASFLAHPEQGERIRANLKGFSARADTLERLEPLLRDDRKKVAYLFDNINYLSGARYRTLDLAADKGLRCLSVSCREVLTGHEYSRKWKLLRLLYALSARLGREQLLPQLRWALPALLSGCDTVCVVSEASRLRGAVSRLEGTKKVQWIHTDYAAWRDRSAWTRAVTKRDAELYSRFDTIVCLSEGLREKFTALYPHLREKTAVVPNFIRVKEIRRLAAEPSGTAVDPEKYNLITVGRMEPEKRYDLVLKTASQLKAMGLAFRWYLVGDGPLMPELRESAEVQNVLDVVSFTGNLENPYPLMKRCDGLVLLSDYEGTPVTVDEAKVLGVPVLARDVGGVKEQLENGEYGRLLPEVSGAAEQLREFLENGCSIASRRLDFDQNYKKIIKKLEKIFLSSR